MKPLKKVLSVLLRWETMLLALLVLLWVIFDARDAARDAELIARGRKAKDVFNFANMLGSMGVYMLYSFMALGMALLLGMGDIDISVGAIAALSASVMGISYRAMTGVGLHSGVSFAISIVLCLLTGSLCGGINGFFVTRFRELFPMIITLGTQLFFRGFCYLFLGGDTLKFDGDATWAGIKVLYNGSVSLCGFNVPTILFWFLGFAVIFFVALHLTTAGRKLFAIGTNRTAALYSGVNVDRFELWMFVICGFMTAITSLFYIGSASATIRADAMTGYEMYAIAVVVLGGFSTGGGKGNIIGVILSVLIFAVMKKGLGTLYGFPDSTVNLAVGLVLVASALLPNIAEYVSKQIRLRRQRVKLPEA
ncbi:MAG: ABC transporter permease [Christensenellales bacterium]|jgi:rhamnose transport system permease protein